MIKNSWTDTCSLLSLSSFSLQLNIVTGRAEVYEELFVDKGHPITGIHIEADGKTEYAMTDRKVSLQFSLRLFLCNNCECVV